MKNLILLTLISIFVLACNEEVTVAKKLIDETRGADQVSYNFSGYFIDSNYTKAKLTSKIARIYNEQRKTILDSLVKVDFYSKTTGKRITYMEADCVVVDDNTKNMYAYGKVFVLSDSSKASLRTNYLFWDNKAQKLLSDKFVTYSSPYERISGWGFESDLNLDNYKFKRVSGEQR